MNRRIALVLRTKNITPSQFAEELGVQRSGISHILNGRNKPSLEFIQKLIKQYPDISMNWLMFGEGPMMNPYPVKEAVMQKTAVATPSKPLMMELFETSKEATDYSAQQLADRVHDNDFLDQSNLKEKGNEREEKIDDQQILISNFDNSADPSFKEKPINIVENSLPKSSNRNDNALQINSNGKKIKRIVIFYDDRSFVEYMPGEE